MDELSDETLMELAEFRKLMHLSPSGERRMRSEQQDWPPHMAVGRKVFYLRDGVRDFLHRQAIQHEAASKTPDCPAAEFQPNQNGNCEVRIERNLLS